MQMKLVLTKDVPENGHNGLGLVLFGQSHSSWIEFKFDGNGYSFFGNLMQHEVVAREATYKALMDGQRVPFYELALGEVPGDLAPWLFHAINRGARGVAADAPPRRIWRRTTGIVTAQVAETLRAVLCGYTGQAISWSAQPFTVGDRVRHAKSEVEQLFAVHRLAQENLVPARIHDPASHVVVDTVAQSTVFCGADWEADWQLVAA